MLLHNKKNKFPINEYEQFHSYSEHTSNQCFSSEEKHVSAYLPGGGILQNNQFWNADMKL
jgi:hypothetical protein